MKKTANRPAADDKRFWDVIATACRTGVRGDFTRVWAQALIKQLKTLPPDEIVRFERWFDDRTDALYTVNHWAAAYLMNGGASDDGFYYWRCWLVGTGKRIYEAALSDPDSLADFADPDGDDCEAEIYSVARNAWEELGLGEDDFDKAYDALGKRQGEKLAGRDWDFDNDRLMRKHLPRLFAKYEGDAEDEDDD